MKPNIKSAFQALALLGLCASAALPLQAKSPHSITIQPIGTVSAGTYDASAAEISAYDPATRRLFVVNAELAHIDVISIADPKNPTIVETIDVQSYGAVANSVAVRDGIIAVAVESAEKTEPGKVVFFDRNLKAVAAVQVGALPDMVTFTPDGRYVVVANEGEPNSQYTIDPEGTVSIIDLSRGVKKLRQSDVRTADFRAFNKETLLAQGVRIFGPNATTAQDLEPEYVTISSDSKTAYVTLQENNAIAVVDLATAKVKQILPLGSKDHSAVAAAATLYNFDPAELPVLGTIGSETITLGGFSGLHFEGIDPVTGRYKFVANTDRGPNAEPTGVRRPFLLPDFTPELVRFELDRTTGKLTLTQRITLQSAPGVPLTGLPNTALAGGTGNTAYNDEVPVDLLGNVLPLDPLGADLEGIVTAADGSFWSVDEYRPAIYHFSAEGLLIDRFVPQGTAAAAGQPAGTFGKEVLPAVLAQRRQNRGFEALAIDGGKIYAFVQSPLRNPVTLSNGALGAMKNIRIVELDPVKLTTKQYMYVMDNADLGGGTNTRADKLGDAVSFGNGEFLVVERDDDKISSDAPELIEKKVYRFNLAGATDVTGKDGLIGSTGKTVDQLTIAELVANKINPVEKILHVDLNTAGYNQVEKVEGLAIIDPWTIAVVNDNDFGVANITVNPDGTFVRNYVPEPVQLGLIVDVRLNGLDASDRDSKINIRQWPVKGLFMPDAIASVKASSGEYLITANEGDAREYIYEDADGEEVEAYVEAIRAGNSKVVLDPLRFPNAAVLKNNANLGRLNLTSASGRNAEGVYEELYAFGTRSFSIWSTDGTLVFDSGDDLEWLTAQTPGTVFNASNSNNDFDNRSDDKGPEPEGVVVGKAFGRTYAFIGLERVGGIMVYDVTEPTAPEFVQYSNFRDYTQATETAGAGDLGPEGLLFIAPEQSPNGKPLLVVANEVSGTTTIYEINKKK